VELLTVAKLGSSHSREGNPEKDSRDEFLAESQTGLERVRTSGREKRLMTLAQRPVYLVGTGRRRERNRKRGKEEAFLSDPVPFLGVRSPK